MPANNRRRSPLPLGSAAFAVLVASVVLGACGGSSGGDTAGGANATDRAFAIEMIDHHEMAVGMAQVAQDKASRPEIKALAEGIVAAQRGEIEEMEKTDDRLAAGEIPVGSLGLSDSMAGMSMHASDLEEAKDLDREFIDMMIPHHQGAIRMARVELAKGKDSQMRQLAQEIIAAQSREIRRMNAWRVRWYGEKSPAGGVPDAQESQSEQQMNDHEGSGHSGM